MTEFNPCRGKQACVERGDRCITCGRSLDEIATTRRLIDELAELAVAMDYRNTEAFTDYVARKVGKKIQYRRENP